MTLEVQLTHRQAYLDQLATNAARLARVALTFDTNGDGEQQLDRAVSFELAFTSQPAIMTGVSVRAGRLVRTKFPNVAAGVWRWQQTPRGFYVGAYLFFVCDSAGQPYRLRHSLVFEAEAIKMLPADLLS